MDDILACLLRGDLGSSYIAYAGVPGQLNEDDEVLMGLEHGELAAHTRKLRGAMCNNLTLCGIQVRYARRPHRHGEMSFPSCKFTNRG
jgi:hypothetical protein